MVGIIHPRDTTKDVKELEQIILDDLDVIAKKNNVSVF